MYHSESQRYLSATCDYTKDTLWLHSLEEENPVIVTQGFIASNEYGETVLLGRGVPTLQPLISQPNSMRSAVKFGPMYRGCSLPIHERSLSARLLLQLAMQRRKNIDHGRKGFASALFVSAENCQKFPMHICCTTHRKCPARSSPKRAYLKVLQLKRFR